MTGDELKQYRFPETLTNRAAGLAYILMNYPGRDCRLGFLDQ